MSWTLGGIKGEEFLECISEKQFLKDSSKMRTYLMGGCVAHRASLDVLVMRKIVAL
jgi:hypothetical protein